jgi:hypothetical protein
MPRSSLVPVTTPLYTSLPAAPVDGQIIDYQADAANGIVWRLRYNAASSSAYKWEFVGGGYLYSQFIAASGVSGTGSGFADVTGGAGPDLTCPLAGDYEVEMGFEFYNPTAQPSIINGAAGIARVGVDANTYNYATAGSVGSNNLTSASINFVIPSCTAGMILRMRYLYASIGNIVYSQRRFRIRPRRVG